MNVTAIHDDDGNIVSLVVGPDDGPRLMPEVPGSNSKQVELADEVLAQLRNADEARVSEILGQWRVDVDRSLAQVVRREQPDGP